MTAPTNPIQDEPNPTNELATNLEAGIYRLLNAREHTGKKVDRDLVIEVVCQMLCDIREHNRPIMEAHTQQAVRDGKISALTTLANKKTPRGEDIHPEYTKGFDEMKSKVKFELQRLLKLQEDKQP